MVIADFLFFFTVCPDSLYKNRKVDWQFYQLKCSWNGKRCMHMQGDDLESEIKISGSLSYISLMSSSNDLNCKGSPGPNAPGFTKCRDVSRVRHCVLGRTHSSFGRREYCIKGPIGRRKKNRMFMQITNSRKKQRHTIRKFVFRENKFYQLIDSSVTVY